MPSTSKRNILIIMSDEQRWDSLGSTGNPTACTPHLDDLAARGTAMTRCYSAYPLCCPARASLWTGLMPHNHHVFGNWRALRPDLRDQGLVHPFAQAGYHTIYTGKWHVPGTTPARFSFAEANAIPAVINGRDRGRYIEPYRDYATSQGYELVPHHIENLTARDVACLRQPGKAPCGTAEIPLEHFLETWQTNQFLEALDRRPDDKPFFAVCSYNAPHFPMIVPAPYDRLVSPESVVLPPNFCAGLEGKPDEVLQSPHIEGSLSEHEWRRLIAHYLGLCALVDAQVGCIMAYLRERGLLDETLVIFTSDHGDMLGAHCLNEKGYDLHYEETLRVPLIVAGPGIPAGQRIKQFVSLIDLLPTLAQLNGIALDQPIDGVSFAPAMTDPAGWVGRPHVVAESYRFDGKEGGNGEYISPAEFDGDRDGVNLSIRTEHHRYIFRWRDRDELYDTVVDPYENTNIRAAPGSDEVVSSLRQTLAASLGDSFPPVARRLLDGW